MLKNDTKILEKAHKAIDEFNHSLVLQDGSKIDVIILYGSVVVGEYHPTKSDIDIMVVANDKSIDEDILELETKVSLKYGVVISALLATKKELEEGKNSGYSFFNKVLKGAVIYERSKRRNKARF